MVGHGLLFHPHHDLVFQAIKIFEKNG